MIRSCWTLRCLEKVGAVIRYIEKQLSTVAGNVIWLNLLDKNLTENYLEISTQTKNLESCASKKTRREMGLSIC